KAKMTIVIPALDFNLWDIIIDGPELPHFISQEGIKTLKPRSSYSDDDRKKVQLNAKDKHAIICPSISNEFNRVSSCSTAKQMWDRLEVTYEGTNQILRCLPKNDEEQDKKKNKVIAFKSSTADSSEEDSDDEMALITRRLKKYLAKKKFGSKHFKKSIPSKSETKKEEIICFECNKPGHYKSECPRLNKVKETIKKKKAMLAT
ncbi:zf-CCHC domain-containing protein, partial [Cephalotus follicularis]